MNLNENVKKLRKKDGLTQIEMAEILKMDQSNYSKCERGLVNFSIDTIMELANFFDVSLDALMGRTHNIRKL